MLAVPAHGSVLVVNLAGTLTTLVFRDMNNMAPTPNGTAVDITLANAGIVAAVASGVECRRRNERFGGVPGEPDRSDSRRGSDREHRAERSNPTQHRDYRATPA